MEYYTVPMRDCQDRPSNVSTISMSVCGQVSNAFALPPYQSLKSMGNLNPGKY